jgi:hypothetical protein
VCKQHYQECIAIYTRSRKGREDNTCQMVQVVVWPAPKVNKTTEWSVVEIGLLIPR